MQGAHPQIVQQLKEYNDSHEEYCNTLGISYETIEAFRKCGFQFYVQLASHPHHSGMMNRVIHHNYKQWKVI